MKYHIEAHLVWRNKWARNFDAMQTANEHGGLGTNLRPGCYCPAARAQSLLNSEEPLSWAGVAGLRSAVIPKLRDPRANTHIAVLLYTLTVASPRVSPENGKHVIANSRSGFVFEDWQLHHKRDDWVRGTYSSSVKRWLPWPTLFRTRVYRLHRWTDGWWSTVLFIAWFALTHCDLSTHYYYSRYFHFRPIALRQGISYWLQNQWLSIDAQFHYEKNQKRSNLAISNRSTVSGRSSIETHNWGIRNDDAKYVQ